MGLVPSGGVYLLAGGGEDRKGGETGNLVGVSLKCLHFSV